MAELRRGSRPEGERPQGRPRAPFGDRWEAGPGGPETDWRPEPAGPETDWRYFAGAGDPSGDPPPHRPVPDLGTVLAVLDGLRGAVPRELQDQLALLVRELLLALRALIDWYLDRLEHRSSQPRVEDIPID